MSENIPNPDYKVYLAFQDVWGRFVGFVCGESRNEIKESMKETGYKPLGKAIILSTSQRVRTKTDNKKTKTESEITCQK